MKSLLGGIVCGLKVGTLPNIIICTINPEGWIAFLESYIKLECVSSGDRP